MMHRHRRGRAHGRAGGRLARFMAHGDLRFLVLKLIGERPRHGYEIIKAIEEMVGGLYSPSPGVIYPTLTLLAERGWIEETASEGSRKQYAITEDGRLSLEANRTTVDAIMARLADPSPGGGDEGRPRRHGRHRGRPVRDAVDSLVRTIRERFHEQNLSDETVDRMVGIVTQAERDILAL